MNRTVVTSVAIAAVSAIICFYLYAASTRYATVSAGNFVYKVDRRTGESVAIYGALEVPVGPPAKARTETAEEHAIRLAENAHDGRIRNWIESQTGELRIIGWKARRVDDEMFVVTYAIDRGSGAQGWAYEVNIEAQLVRKITGDRALEKKHGFRYAPVDARDQSTALTSGTRFFDMPDGQIYRFDPGASHGVLVGPSMLLLEDQDKGGKTK